MPFPKLDGITLETVFAVISESSYRLLETTTQKRGLVEAVAALGKRSSYETSNGLKLKAWKRSEEVFCLYRVLYSTARGEPSFASEAGTRSG